jgi:hypothetical protein
VFGAKRVPDKNEFEFRWLDFTLTRPKELVKKSSGDCGPGLFDILALESRDDAIEL